jgi:tetratricopeptide (TPR) repeat protein
LAREGNDRSVLARVLYALGDINWRLGTLDKARGYLEESLALARSMNDVPRILFALNRLGTVSQGDLDVAEPFLAETLQLAKTSGNRERAMAALNNLGDVSSKRGDWARARTQHEEALAIARELGARQDVALFLLNVSADATVLKDLPAAHSALREGLRLSRELSSQREIMVSVFCYSQLLAADGNVSRSLALAGLCQRHPSSTAEVREEIAAMIARLTLDADQVRTGLSQGEKLDFDATVDEIERELSRGSG